MDTLPKDIKYIIYDYLKPKEKFDKVLKELILCRHGNNGEYWYYSQPRFIDDETISYLNRYHNINLICLSN